MRAVHVTFNPSCSFREGSGFLLEQLKQPNSPRLGDSRSQRQNASLQNSCLFPEKVIFLPQFPLLSMASYETAISSVESPQADFQ